MWTTRARLRHVVPLSCRLSAVVACVLFSALFGSAARAGDIVGFTEPYRTVRVAAPESGTISSIAVQVGETVRTGEVISELDYSVLEVSLEITRKSAEARGAYLAALAETRLRREMHRKLESLRDSRAASQEEVDRAAAELEIAAANLLSTEESLEIRRLEHRRVQAEIERRRIRAPIDGVVIEVFREAGEFASPNDPDILTVVQLDPLRATFSVESERAQNFRPRSLVRVVFDIGTAADGVVEYISPVTDAQSGTVEVRVRIENPNQKFRSGERCVMQP